MHPLQTYLASMQRDFGTQQAVKETSYYPHLQALFNAIGDKQSPKVFCVVHITSNGSGIPDGGFFSSSQKRTLDKSDDKLSASSPLEKLPPERGVLEVKGAAANLDTLKLEPQVAKYLSGFGQVLITNLREFALLERDENGQACEVERFSLSDSAAKFWALDPKATSDSRGEELAEFLTRCLLSGAPLASPQHVAAFLASYAREARLRLEKVDLPTLAPLKSALEEALGVKFVAPDSRLTEKEQQERGDRFFRATLVQTLFYGLFSAWLSHVREKPNEPFNWKQAQWSLHVPMVSVIFEQLMQPSRLKSLDLRELIELAARTLSRVQVGAFFEKWQGALAVQYFYEPFLERFDPLLREELGVYYTPPEVVRYMVERVHRVLIDELKCPLGLADEKVVILDPCCGTGAYLVEVVRKIAQVLEENGAGAGLSEDLKRAVVGDAKAGKKPRVLGFEILPAPFVVSHHAVQNLLASDECGGVKLAEDERAAIYLTNSLTGWGNEPNAPLPFEAFEAERKAAQDAKREQDILVIIGNPPYKAFTKEEDAGDLVAPYKAGLQSEWGIKKFNLGDLYVRFFRIAERRLERSGEGVLCFISNFSYLNKKSFVVMRQSLMQSFDTMWIDVLNGDSRETGKRTPDGAPDPSVFSTSFNREGIRVGTAINTMVRHPASLVPEQRPAIQSRDFWGVRKREELLESLQAPQFGADYKPVNAQASNYFAMRPLDVGADYESWPLLSDLCATPPINGLMEKRGGALIAMSKSVLKERMSKYFDAAIPFSDLSAVHRGLASPAARFDAQATRERIQSEEGFLEDNLLRYAARPFDVRWCYYSGVRPLWNEPRPALRAQLWEGNSFLISRPAGVANPEGVPLWFSSTLADNDALRGHAYCFPIFQRLEVKYPQVVEGSDGTARTEMRTRLETTANLSPDARKYLEGLGFASPDEASDEGRHAAALLWRHALAVGYAPAYRLEHGDGISSDWPRVPLPDSAEELRASAELGAQVAALLDAALPVPGVSSSALRPELLALCALARVDAGQIKSSEGDLKIEVNWGSLTSQRRVSPGQGRVREREPNEAERGALQVLGLDIEADGSPARVCDVFLNERVFWRAIPRRAWESIIGGYPVLKKWLSYRDFKVLGRDLTLNEAREVEAIARRLCVLASLEARLDESYQACAASALPWNSAAAAEPDSQE